MVGWLRLEELLTWLSWTFRARSLNLKSKVEALGYLDSKNRTGSLIPATSIYLGIQVPRNARNIGTS